VSRPVISAGLVELEKLGFVEIVPRQGVYVSDYRRKGTVETLVAIMRYNGGAMRKNEVRSLLETRDSLEMPVRKAGHRTGQRQRACRAGPHAGRDTGRARLRYARRKRFSASCTSWRCCLETCCCR
jgi:hypothetical protein